MSTHAAPSPTADFWFYAGEWDVANRRRNADGIWEEFAATCSVTNHVDGLVQIDHFDAPDFPGRGHVKAITVRAYDAHARTWSLVWLSNYAAPDLRPLVGRWDGDEGDFRQTIEDADGHPLDARFRWQRLNDGHARWAQATSRDGGATWDWDWEMEMTRRA